MQNISIMTQIQNILLKVLHVASWIAAIGLCVKAGTLLVSFTISLFVNEQAAQNLYMGLNLDALRQSDMVHYCSLVLCIFSIFALEAYWFFIVVFIFKKINLVHPFHESVGKLFRNMSAVALMIGIVSKITTGYADHIAKEGAALPPLFEHIGFGDAFIFFAGILFFIYLVFEKGIALQKENEYTI